jgi:hypothetical protein
MTKYGKMFWTGGRQHAQEAYEKCIRILVGKLEEKRRLGKP